MFRYLTSLILCISFSLIAQQRPVPNKRLDHIAETFVKEYPNDSMRAMAIYFWIHKNLKYDLKSYLKLRFPAYNASPAKVFKKGKALCSGFAALYEDMCLRSKLQCIQISGYTHNNYPGSTKYYTDHSWNALKLNGQWQYLDVTADNGHIKPKEHMLIYWVKDRLGIPYAHTHYKYMERSELYYWTAHPKSLITKQYPTFFKAQNTDTLLGIKAFENERYDTSIVLDKNGYKPQDLNAYLMHGRRERMLLEINEVRKVNPNDHFTIFANYYNYLLEDCSSKDKRKRNFGCSNNIFIDSALIHGRTFLQCNKALLQYQMRFISNENRAFSASIKKLQGHNSGLRNKSIRKNFQYFKAIQGMKLKGDRNTASFESKYKQRFRGAKSLKNPKDSIVLKLKRQHLKNLKQSDSLYILWTANFEKLNQELLLFSLRSNTLKELCVKRSHYSRIATTMEKDLQLYKAINATALCYTDTLTRLQNIENEDIMDYEKVRFKRQYDICHTIDRQIFQLHLSSFKIQGMLSQTDSIVLQEQGMQSCIMYSTNLYTLYQTFINGLKNHNKDLSKILTAEAVALQEASKICSFVNGYRSAREQYRFNAYNRMSLRMISALKSWKKLKKTDRNKT